MEMEISRQVREMDEIAAFLRSEIRRLQRNLLVIPRELTESIEMFRRTAAVINTELNRLEELRKKFRVARTPKSYSSSSFPRPPSRGPPGPGAGGSNAKSDTRP
ncbi:uncharacterized protein LOC127751559 [Frankliniella occidentalis]|uniref:Uncharacterized protein LOC127751393 n=1 Tax=Frankliniella occidentalis TaxID=133901 RepID=A0A9C6XUM7_FRAOC|nr:uncharacterized protein LOC127751393 [Frankliniella occidentalis]XP_052131246.1 uncharacterized protein LOC127751559 [Frankliniella occidentalis]